MDAGPGTDLGSLGWYLGIWVTMMAAMMLPSATPMVLLFSKISEQSSRRPALATALFVTGYLIAWTAYGLVHSACSGWCAARPALPRVGPGGTGGHRRGDRARRRLPADTAQARVPASLPHAAELRHAPLARRPARAVRMGIEHGAWCVGCCWALMVLLFAVGVMSITWMLVVAAIVFAEKVLPIGEQLARAVAVRADRARDLGRARARERPGPDPSGRNGWRWTRCCARRRGWVA